MSRIYQIYQQFYQIYTQFFPPSPPLTGSNLPNQAGKVFIITGGSSGIGFELAKILYIAGGTVYIMTRTEASALKAIDEIKDSATASTSEFGILKFIHLDLADLSTIPASVAAFCAAETRLDVLFNNAGIASSPLDYKTAQGIEPHFGINCVGPFLLTKLLLPVLSSTAAQAPSNSVRIVWTSSILVDMLAPKGGVTIKQLTNPDDNRNEHYSASKAGNWFLASEYHARLKDTGIVSLTQNPGSLRTNVWRTTPGLYYYPYYFLLSKSIGGAYTNLWAGLSEDITLKDGGRYVVPFGRWHSFPREDVLLALKGENDGGTGEAMEFWSWCEEQVEPYVPKE
ncbi:hypothetical protein MMC28_007043 [Mycoblastus sanguinarius]|nr:hypothetical protein [Mycoblastus sanguinarius]